MPRSAATEFVGPRNASRAAAMATLIGERLLREHKDFLATRGLAGLSGTAYALLQLAKVSRDQRYLEAGKHALRCAAHADDKPLLGLFTGVSGLRAVAALLAREDGKLDGLVRQCDDYVEQILPSVTAKVPLKTFDEYDVLAGWCGVRLSRCASGARADDNSVALLRWLISDDEHWRCPHPLRLSEPPENDLGLAHGIAGVLSTLALTINPDAEFGALLSRQATALRRRAVRAKGLFGWPPYAQAPPGMIARAAWCYGAVGVGAAIYWVARLLGDEELRRFALEALEEHASAPCDRWGLADFALCHGTLGNALVYASVGTASGSERLMNSVAAAVDFALEGLERDGGACWGTGPDGNRYDYPDELNGAAGIVLALLTLSGEIDSAWLRLHALEPLAE